MSDRLVPALVYCDVACELFPELADRIKEEVAVFYSDQAERCGEHLVKAGVITEEQNRLVLLAQKAQRELLSKADVEELHKIQAAVHLRTVTSLESLSIIVQGLRR
jgi:hypothetical protein